jgi:hypothetical protein
MVVLIALAGIKLHGNRTDNDIAKLSHHKG